MRQKCRCLSKWSGNHTQNVFELISHRVKTSTKTLCFEKDGINLIQLQFTILSSDDRYQPYIDKANLPQYPLYCL